jgi:queuine tRNA-ribosyltransferase subunit QTRTD1
MADESCLKKLDQLPPEMIEFALLKTTGALAPRLGRISLAKRKTILTPAFIGNTSRGGIPHISQDNFRKSIDVNGVYIPLEDCMCPSSPPRHSYTADNS